MRRFKLSVEGRYFILVAIIVMIAIYVVIWNHTTDKPDQSALYVDTINYGQIRPPTAIVFEYEGKEIGQLEWGTGEFQFTGEADQSAKVFFEYFLKPYIDQYIKDELERRKE